MLWTDVVCCIHVVISCLGVLPLIPYVNNVSPFTVPTCLPLTAPNANLRGFATPLFFTFGQTVPLTSPRPLNPSPPPFPLSSQIVAGPLIPSGERIALQAPRSHLSLFSTDVCLIARRSILNLPPSRIHPPYHHHEYPACPPASPPSRTIALPPPPPPSESASGTSSPRTLNPASLRSRTLGLNIPSPLPWRSLKVEMLPEGTSSPRSGILLTRGARSSGSLGGIRVGERRSLRVERGKGGS